MQVIAFDPFLSPERAHGPRRREGRARRPARPRRLHHAAHAADRRRRATSCRAENLAKTKKGVRIINCARGGLVDEAALREALEVRPCRRRGASTCSSDEPAKENPLFGLPERRLHAASRRLDHRGAGERGAAGGRADVRLPAHAARSPTRSTSPRSRPRKRRSLKPFIALAEKLGSFAGQLTETGIKEVTHRVRGRRRRAQHQGADRGRARRACCGRCCQDVNMVSAPIVAKERGIVDRGGRRARREGDYEIAASRSRSITEQQERSRRRHGVPRRQAAHRRDQGHQGRRRVRALDALRDQRGQAGLHRPLRQRCWARPASTSPPSPSAATRRAARPSRWSQIDGDVPAAGARHDPAIPGVKQAKNLKF